MVLSVGIWRGSFSDRFSWEKAGIVSNDKHRRNAFLMNG
jgi:hypothetical protein